MEERKERFTPGPWKHVINRTTILDAEGDRIAVVTRKGLYHFTAELIAKAPEMYAELKDLLDAMESGLFPQVAPGVDYPAVMEKKWELRKLLKEARGEI